MHPDNGHDRHHLLRPNQIVLAPNLGHQQPNVVLDRDADLGEDHGGVLPDERLIDHPRLVGGAHLREYDPFQSLQLVLLESVGAVGDHCLDETIGHGVNGDRGLLIRADDVVVEGGASDDVAARGVDVSRLVDDGRWVAGTCGDRLLVGLQRLLDDAGPSGHQENTNVGVMHQIARRLQSRVRGRSDQIRRTSAGNHRSIEKLDVLDRDQAGTGVDVENHRVARRDDRDRIVDDRRSGVGRWCDRPDDTIRRILGDHHAGITGHNMRFQVLRARRLGRHQSILDDLVLGTAHTSLFSRHVGEPLPFPEHGRAHRVDNRLSDLETHLPVDLERLAGGSGGLIDAGVDSVAELHFGNGELITGTQCRTGSVGEFGRGNPAFDPIDYRADFAVAELGPIQQLPPDPCGSGLRHRCPMSPRSP